MLEEGQSKELNANQPKVSSPTNAHQPKSKQLNTLSYILRLTSKEVSNEIFIHAIVILGGSHQKSVLDLPEYQYQNTSHQSIERLRVSARLVGVTKLPILLTEAASDRSNSKNLSDDKFMGVVFNKRLGNDAKWLEE